MTEPTYGGARMTIGSNHDELAQLAGTLLEHAADVSVAGNLRAALTSLAELLETMAEVAGADTDHGFDDATARLALAWHRTSRVLDATRPGRPAADALLELARQLRAAGLTDDQVDEQLEHAFAGRSVYVPAPPAEHVDQRGWWTRRRHDAIARRLSRTIR